MTTIKEKLMNVIDKFRKEQEIDTAAVERAKRLQEAMKQQAKTLPK